MDVNLLNEKKREPKFINKMNKKKKISLALKCHVDYNNKLTEIRGASTEISLILTSVKRNDCCLKQI
jgi:hypothetical protein